MKKHLHEFYLDWVNNWLTVERMAEHYGLDPDMVEKLIDIGRIIHERGVK